MKESLFTYRQQVGPTDPLHIGRIIKATGFFSEEETAIAVELVEERLARGKDSGYEFLIAEDAEDRMAGYSCFGFIEGTRSSFDLYWIAVHPDYQGHGLGRELLTRSEEIIGRMGGENIYVETSSREQYVSTRAFYERCGYRQEALLRDFYGPGDSKVIYVKTLPPRPEGVN